MNLNIKQRIGAVIIYMLLIIGLGVYLSKSLKFVIDTNNPLNAILIVTGLALILGSYITEPHFTKPIEVIARWLAIFLFIIGLNNKECLMLHNYWIYASIIFILVAISLIFTHGIERLKKYEKIQKLCVEIICKISRPEIVFGALYFDIAISFFRLHPVDFPLLIAFGVLLIFTAPVNKTILWFSKLLRFLKTISNKEIILGYVIGHESADFYKVEITGDILAQYPTLKGQLVILESLKNGIVGLVIDENFLLNKKWIYVVSLRNEENNLVTINLNSLQLSSNQKTIFSKSNVVSLISIDNFSTEVKDKIENNEIYCNHKNIIGYVGPSSTINQIKFHSLFSETFLIEKGIGEGSIIQTKIGTENVLYQIIDARTNEEPLEYKDSNGYTIGTAQKIGKYIIGSNELNTVKWLPEIYRPIFLLKESTIEYESNKFIGKLPKTNYGIPIKFPHELVTHNTAILGILGIGKSCLTFELIQKVINETTVKIICIDLTNQYAKELKEYFADDIILDNFDLAQLTELRTKNRDNGNPDNPETWGNEKYYSQFVENELTKFVSTDKRILCLNPDLHSVSKAATSFKITNKVDLTASEKTRIISERLFLKARNEGESIEAKYLLVFEEAHSLVPEWNSVANSGDVNATNGIAKVILQGRKYGLGSFVITQRTANISKSILNQCNTIFAMRIFDDTGKQFLENYIGSEYSNLLPTLEERHAIAIGKALKLKQPVILELNDKNEVQIKTDLIIDEDDDF